MFKLFSGGGAKAWPLAKVVTALKGRYQQIETVGEDGPIKVFGVQDHGVNFVVAVVESAPDSGEIIELGFLARFVGFPVTGDAVERLNANLHIAVASLEGADVFLMVGLQVSGPYDDRQFSSVMDSWRRDLTLTLMAVSGDDSAALKAFPAARLEAARAFATNTAPEATDERGLSDLLASFLGADAADKKHCDACGGRGKTGLIARHCSDCDGTGLISARRR